MFKRALMVAALVSGVLLAGPPGFPAVEPAHAGASTDATTQDEPADTDIDASTTATPGTGTDRTAPEKPSQTSSGNAGRTDQDRAFDAERRGIVLPYGRVLKKVKQAVPGDIVRVRLQQNKSSVWTYEVTVLDQSGRYIQLSLNARTGTVISKRRR
jgi:hypothetical protein